MTNFKLAIACDHGGYELKQEILAYLDKEGIAYEDFGCDSTASVNYPVYASKVCKAIQSGDCTRGILVCGTGIGMSMAANKHKGIRAAVCSDTFSAEMTRRHNDANVLCFGARVLGKGVALQIVDAFLDAPFEGGRHKTRVDMFMALED